MFGTRTQLSTTRTDLASVVRLDPNNFNSFSFSFVLDKTLQLIKTPVTNPIIHNPSSMLFPNTFEVFHHNLVSVKVGNNTFTYVMIVPSHKPLLSSRDFFKQSSRTSCAFGLEFTTQIFELPFNLLYFSTIIKPTVTTDGKIIYSEVNTQNNVLRTTVLLNGSNLFRECEQEETPAFFINPKQTFLNIPIEVFFVTSGNSEWNLYSSFDSSQTQNIVLERSTAREVISHTYSVDSWFRFSFLDHSTGLFDTSYSELALQSSLSQGFIDKRMEFNVIFNLSFPCLIDTELQSFSIDIEGFNYSWSRIDSNLCSYSCSHKDNEIVELFKCFGNKEERAFLPRINPWVSCPKVL